MIATKKMRRLGTALAPLLLALMAPALAAAAGEPPARLGFVHVSKGLLTLAAVALAVIVCTAGWRLFVPLEAKLERLARRRVLAMLTVGLLPLAFRALLLPVMPAPEPQTHDEFSYLLAADTFAHGRLTNPAHPMAEHFESMHILVRPSYASMYPVGQGLILAAGWRLFGHPWAGVWISIGLMGAAICWMLQGWVSPGWAFLGATLAAMRLGIFSYWMNSYWGGAVAAIGGALVLGAVPRLLRKSSWRDAAWMGLGLGILANSRPFEGLVFALALAGVGFWKVARTRALWPTLLILAATGFGMLYYFHRVTGHSLVMPYVLNRQTMATAPLFVWQKPRPEPVYHHAVLRDFYAWELAVYSNVRSTPLLTNVLEKARTYWRFFFGWLFTIPLVALPWLWKEHDAHQLSLAAAIFFFAALSLEVWQNPHYAAPATGLFFLILTLAMQRLAGWTFRGAPAGLFLVRALLPACALILVANSLQGPSGPGSRWMRIAGKQEPASFGRAAVLHRLEAAGGRHLVVVRYQSGHNVHDEWVYNEAEIDAAPVVWARDMGVARNMELLQYFNNRQVWLAEPDLHPPRITPYRSSIEGTPR